MTDSIKDELISALDAERHVRDYSAYSLLDKLIYGIRSRPEGKQELIEFLREAVTMVIDEAENPRALVNLFVALEVKDIKVADVLERAVTSHAFPTAEKRLAAITLLRALDRTLPPSYVVPDTEIRALAPLQWLDLSLPLLVDVAERRKAILSMLEAGSLSVTDLHARLQQIWSAAGTDPIVFLQAIASRLSPEDRSMFFGLVMECFGMDISSTVRQDAGNVKPKVRVSAKLQAHVQSVSKHDEEQLRAHIRKARVNSIVSPFQNFKRVAA